MAEKKMTKAELKKLEVENKRCFIAEVFKDFIESYLRVLNYSRFAMQLTVVVKNDNHYLTFQEFGKCFTICIYTNGNVEIKMKASGSGEYKEQLFEYSPSKTQQMNFLSKLESGLCDIILETALEKFMPYEVFLLEGKGNNLMKRAYDIYRVKYAPLVE